MNANKLIGKSIYSNLLIMTSVRILLYALVIFTKKVIINLFLSKILIISDVNIAKLSIPVLPKIELNVR